jgi:hypothetical protein
MKLVDLVFDELLIRRNLQNHHHKLVEPMPKQGRKPKAKSQSSSFYEILTNLNTL